jgi:hypothetical protein
MALTERIHSNGAILARQKYFLLIEPGPGNNRDTMFDNYPAILVELRTFLQVGPPGPGCGVNKSQIGTPYGLRTMIQQCK